MKKVISIAMVFVMALTMVTVGVASVSADTTATINGQSANVGDTATVSVYLKADKTIEDFQGNLTFDSTVLKLESFEMPSTSEGVMYNTTHAGYVYHSGSCFSNPYDFTTEKVFAVAKFTVAKAGATEVASNWEAIHDTDSVSLLDENDKLNERASQRITVEVKAPETTTKPTSIKRLQITK